MKTNVLGLEDELQGIPKLFTQEDSTFPTLKAFLLYGFLWKLLLNDY